MNIYLHKIAASRLRRLVTVRPAFERWSSPTQPSVYRMYLANRRKHIGELVVGSRQKGRVVIHSDIDKKFRGFGLGKKLYGSALMREGRLTPGVKQSGGALRIWDSLRRRYVSNDLGGVLAQKRGIVSGNRA